MLPKIDPVTGLSVADARIHLRKLAAEVQRLREFVALAELDDAACAEVLFKINENTVTTDSGCRIWQGACDVEGYGRMYFAGRTHAVTRVVWWLSHGSIPVGMFLCHKCDVPSCVSLEHLFLGTPQDNVADMVAKGRNAKGDRNGSRLHPETRPRGLGHPLVRNPEYRSYGDTNGSRTHPEKRPRGDAHWSRSRGVSTQGEHNAKARVTEAVVRSIRDVYARKEASLGDLAAKYGLSISGVQKIVLRKTWRHVD